MLKKLFVYSTVLIASLPVLAQEMPEKEETKSFTISGFVDGYYRYDAGRNLSNNRTSFTNAHNSFELGMASLKLEGTSGKVGFVADLGIGKRAQEFAYNDAGILQGIKQLYATYAPAEWLKFTMGSWATHVGYELVDAPANRNYSMSYLFSWGPFSHTGIKADITTGKSGFMLGLANPTDYRTAPVNSRKFLLAQYSLAASENVKIYLNYVGGQRTDSVKIRQIDAVLTAKLSDKFNIGYNATYQHTKTVTDDAIKSDKAAEGWWGSALYLNLDASEKTGFTLRSEIFSDKKQLVAMAYAPVGASIFANTLSCNLKAGPLTIIPEIRLETSGQNVFVNKKGGSTSSSSSALVAVVYSF